MKNLQTKMTFNKKEFFKLFDIMHFSLPKDKISKIYLSHLNDIIKRLKAEGSIWINPKDPEEKGLMFYLKVLTEHHDNLNPNEIMDIIDRLSAFSINSDTFGFNYILVNPL